MDASRPTFRFAPSPNGRLHLGHASSALLNAGLATRFGGRFLVRIEDIDTVRCTPPLMEACLADLAWLGLDWERPERRQSAHFPDYVARLDALRQRGLVYRCTCTRKEIAEAASRCQPDGAPLYPGTCRRCDPAEMEDAVAAGTPYAWRLDLQAALRATGTSLSYDSFDPAGGERKIACDPGAWGDVILARKDTPTSYHLCVVHDDALQGVTHVVRGKDLEAATDIHVVLQRLFDVPTPLYHHHDLIADEGGAKLAKSRGSISLATLREAGTTAAAVRARLGFR